MKIQVACESCNKSYSVKPELAGRRVKCKQCGHQFRIPESDPEVVPVIDVEPLPDRSTSAPSATAASPIVPVATPANVPGSGALEKNVMNAFPQNATERGFDHANPPNLNHMLGGTMASNPGNVKVSKLRYALA